MEPSSLLVLALTSLKMLVLRMMSAVMVTRCRITFILEEPWGLTLMRCFYILLFFEFLQNNILLEFDNSTFENCFTIDAKLFAVFSSLIKHIMKR